MKRMIAGFAVAALTAVLPPAFAGDASTPASVVIKISVALKA
jgi:hypothetical protein